MATDLLPVMRYLFKINVPLRGGLLLINYNVKAKQRTRLTCSD